LIDGHVSSMRLQGIDFDQVERERHEATQQFDDHLDDLGAWRGLRRLNRPRAEDATALLARAATIGLASDVVDRRRSVDRAQLQRDCEGVA
jgi:hypothetical protein